MNNQNSQKKVAVITGGFGYVGSVIAKQLSSQGFLVALVYNTADKEKRDRVMGSLIGEGHMDYYSSLQSVTDTEELLQKIEKDMGVISVCVHTAGKKPERKKLHLTTVEDLHSQIENTIIASFVFLTACSRLLKQNQKGLLIGITTIGVIVPEATKSLGAYIPAKYAVQGMLTMLKDELAPYHVEVHSIAPGFMSGGMNSDIPQAFVKMVQSKTSHNELASADTIAKTIVDLCNKSLSCDALTIPIAPEYNL